MRGRGFICGAALGQQGQAQFVAVAGRIDRSCHSRQCDSMPEGARPTGKACHGGCRCFRGSCLCNKSSSSFQHVMHTHYAIYFPSEVNTATLCYGSNAVY
ncbi:hypothetical protein XENOCAPTIV_022823 [Xenoophorus captivus]|uniref:Uncharacterized protein n=1 Tax=Xenoophorus captivus TaxID=1517983 RepID=A0ABV0RRS9_9TELE